MDFERGFNCSSNVKITDEEKYCALCQIQFKSVSDHSEHRESKLHRVNYFKAWLKVNIDDCIEDKHGCTITCKRHNLHDDGSMHFYTPVNKSVKYILTVKNSGFCPVFFQNVDFLRDMKVATLDDDLGQVSDGQVTNLGVTKTGKNRRIMRLEHNAEYAIELTCKSEFVGMYYIPIVFQFTLEALNQYSFVIVRMLGLHFVSNQLNAIDQEYISTDKKKVAIRGGVSEIIPGKQIPRNPQKEKLQKAINLRNYFPPKNLLRLCRLRDWNPQDNRTIRNLHPVQLGMMEELLDLFEFGLDEENYRKYMTSLLHIEEIHELLELEECDMEIANFTIKDQNADFYFLEVPGIQEKRPCLLRGDKVYARIRLKNDLLDSIEYEGIIHDINKITLTVGLSREFTRIFSTLTNFYVRFAVSRMPYRFMHNALEYVTPVQLQHLFPLNTDDQSLSSELEITQITPFNSNIGKNKEQKQAVMEILNPGRRQFPYLLFGPPGTGKTMTLIEAIKQVWKCYPQSRILVCAPSNSACDTVTERLLENDDIPSKQIFRMHAASRDPKKISTQVLRCSNYDHDEKSFYYHNINELKNFRIVITTLVTVGRLVLAAFPQTHFTHLFIDEAGQALEPESLIPIAGLIRVGNNTKGKSIGSVILAGDPKQLGPVLKTRFRFIHHGLQISLLERLMTTCAQYQRQQDGHYNPKFLTKLVQNYRSHPKILDLPNRLFYDGELIPCADKSVVNSLCQWEGLVKKQFPLIFHGVMGREKREGQNPSLFNTEEICTILTYVEKLMKPSRNGNTIKGCDIGIISPYRKQVEKIKHLLSDKSYKDIRVGSTEEFQGQERRVMIISAVRSNSNVLALIAEMKMGFLTNARRFNVAITRAKALLIIIGNPYVLNNDEHWGRLLRYCLKNNAYKGCHFERDDGGIDDVYERFMKFNFVPDELESTLIRQMEFEYQPEDSEGYYE